MFLYLHLMDTHYPHERGPQAMRFFGDSSYDASEKFNKRGRPKDEVVLDRRDLRYLRALYDGSLARTDAAIGRFVEALRQEGILEDSIIANNQELNPHPRVRGATRPGGLLYREGIAKISAFSRACNDDGIPIIWLQDISGFDIGPEAEKEGLLGYGSNLIYTNSTNAVPMITVLLRKASGAGYYAITKIQSRTICEVWARAHGIQTICLLFCALGPRPTRTTGQDFHRFYVVYEDLHQACRLALELESVPDHYQELNLLSFEGHGKYSATRARRILGFEPEELWEDYFRRPSEP